MRSYTANQANKVLNRTGAFWKSEVYDHWVRDDHGFQRIIHYIENNPVKAGLVVQPEDWRFSSACDRAQNGLEPFVTFVIDLSSEHLYSQKRQQHVRMARSSNRHRIHGVILGFSLWNIWSVQEDRMSKWHGYKGFRDAFVRQNPLFSSIYHLVRCLLYRKSALWVTMFG